MTIKGLWDYVQRKAKEALQFVPCKSFSRTRVAVDMMGFCYPIMMDARFRVARNWDVVRSSIDEEAINPVYMRLFMNALISLLESGITPIFVFEFGRNPLKKKTDEKRTFEREYALERIATLRGELQADVFGHGNKRKVEELRKLEAQLKLFPKSVKEATFDLLVKLGVPTVRGKKGVEAERIASILCMVDVASAVYSPDGDCLAHGAPIQIRDRSKDIFTDGFGDRAFSVCDRTTLLELLDVTSEEFTELCVCSGCDYNENMKNIGFKKSLDLIYEHGSIENFPEKYDTTCLLHSSVLPAFGMASVDELVSEECVEYYNIKNWKSFSLQIAVPKSIDGVLEKYKLTNFKDEFLQKAGDVPPANDYVHFETVGGFTQVNFPDGGVPFEK